MLLHHMFCKCYIIMSEKFLFLFHVTNNFIQIISWMTENFLTYVKWSSCFGFFFSSHCEIFVGPMAYKLLTHVWLFQHSTNLSGYLLRSISGWLKLPLRFSLLVELFFEWPNLASFDSVTISFHLWVMDITVEWEMLNRLEIFLQPSPHL